MGKASWQYPESGPWIDIKSATFVIESTRHGGMGAPAVVPFQEISAAKEYISQYGGRIVGLKDIPADYVLGMVDIPDTPEITPSQ